MKNTRVVSLKKCLVLAEMPAKSRRKDEGGQRAALFEEVQNSGRTRGCKNAAWPSFDAHRAPDIRALTGVGEEWRPTGSSITRRTVV